MSEVITDTKVFGVFADVGQYAMLQETALELIMQIDEPVGLYGKPLADNWTPMEVTWFYNPDERLKPQPDIAAFGAIAFAASAETCEKLRPFINGYVEFLPINVDGWRWYIIHVLAREDIFNEAQSQRKLRRDGTPMRMFKKLVLDGDRVSDGVLFRVQGLSLGIYSTNLPNSFMTVVRKLGLSGLTFQDIN
uniref:hypothetical protein n=1 Tax=Rheinheimera sp. TaxID=1869214 RepID=UPI0040481A51